MYSPNVSLPFTTLRWSGGVDGDLFVLDQRKLPAEEVELKLNTVDEVFDAIKTLAVRGAPAIGAAAAYGMVVGARRGVDAAGVRSHVQMTRGTLETSRPTAYNLFGALERTTASIANADGDRTELLETLLAEAKAIEAEDARSCLSIGTNALTLLPHPIHAMTHCNAGALATCGLGTALSPFYLAHAQEREVKVFARETRPLLQGARLTTWELARAGIDVTLVVDSAAAHLMSQGRINCIITGADRIARNGDAANKIGTCALALQARYYKIPFYIAAPLSTFDPSLETGNDIEIEERGDEEVTTFAGSVIAPSGIKCGNPAFDVTPAELITALITDKGTAQPVNRSTVAKLLG